LKNNLYSTTPSILAFKIFVSATLLIILCSSCSNNQKAKGGKYFAIDSLVKEQVKYLSAVKATITKETLLNNKTDTAVFTPPDTMLWSKELDAFLQLKDMNKPIHHGAYTVEDNLLDTQSNLKVKLFKGTNEQNVKWLKLYYHDSISKLKKIEARFDEENPLYESERLLTMEFQEFNNKTLLTSYAIIGGQKMFMADTVEFSIKGKIKIN
jgi:hypothetical protein